MVCRLAAFSGEIFAPYLRNHVSSCLILRRMISRRQLSTLRHIAIPSFACGALMATLAIHMLSGGGGHAHYNHRRRLENLRS